MWNIQNGKKLWIRKKPNIQRWEWKLGNSLNCLLKNLIFSEELRINFFFYIKFWWNIATALFHTYTPVQYQSFIVTQLVFTFLNCIHKGVVAVGGMCYGTPQFCPKHLYFSTWEAINNSSFAYSKQLFIGQTRFQENEDHNTCDIVRYRCMRRIFDTILWLLSWLFTFWTVSIVLAVNNLEHYFLKFSFQNVQELTSVNSM